MRLKDWQARLGIIGLLAWMLVMPLSATLEKYHWVSLYKFDAGYILGFITAFSGFVLWEFMCGRGNRFIDPSPWFRWLSYIMLAIGLVLSALALLVQLSGNTDWLFNTGALLAGVVVRVGLLPTIKQLDRSSLRNLPAPPVSK